MSLDYIPVASSEFDKAFREYKLGLKSVISEVFGWDEEFQYERFSSSYELSWLYWVLKDGEPQAQLCYKLTNFELHLHLLIVFEEHRNKGLGREIMSYIHDLADEASLRTTLSSFRNNAKAITFYENLGYEVTDEEEHFLEFSKMYKAT